MNDNKIKNSPIIMYTGKKGQHSFHVGVTIHNLTHDQLKDKYIEVSDDLFYTQEAYNKLKRHWLVKLLSKLKIL